ncbi:hypothetical protein, partial [Bordetella trematum]|uniref:hypothetical protein n=1 Tax=Bordetella trematum TaxID=123899 RepID=UPI001C12EE7A
KHPCRAFLPCKIRVNPDVSITAKPETITQFSEAVQVSENLLATPKPAEAAWTPPTFRFAITTLEHCPGTASFRLRHPVIKSSDLLSER